MYKTWIIALCLAACAVRAGAQDAPTPTAPAEPGTGAPQHDMASMAPSNRWMWMNDGVLFATFNDQGSPRGQTEFKSQNWFMTMVQRKVGAGQLTLKGMFSAEPLTQTERGYSELFQMGEAYNRLENIDYQHPHDLFMQLAAAYRMPLGSSTGLSISGGPVGEATLGPVAFMHRPSAGENPTAPLSHHTLDSTHVSEGVVAVSLDHGPWIVEGSAFHGREPDQNRYDLETGALDSWAARVWYRPSPSWLAQVSYGFIKEPEQLEPGDERRTTASVAWMRASGSDYLAVIAAVGRNQRIFDTNTAAFLSEATLHRGGNSVYARTEVMQVTSEHLLFPSLVHKPHPGELIDVLGAFTAGFVHDISSRGPLEIGIGADATIYAVPSRLASFVQTDPSLWYGDHPSSFHVFMRLRPRMPAMGHMWNMMMPRPGM